jgi:Uma2 family endonuclease
MAGVRAHPRVTFAELATWPDDGRRYELYDGEVIVVPAPNLRHQRTVAAVFQILKEYEDRVGGYVVLSPFDIVLSQYDVLEPDVVYFGRGKRPLLNPRTAAYTVPDLAVEVLSPSTEKRDRGRKLELLERYGLPEYWLVDPERRSFEPYARGIRGGLEAGMEQETHQEYLSPTLAGLSFAVARLFDEP